MVDETISEAQLPLDSAGARLRRARETAGLSRADVAARTKIAERQLAAIEEERFGDLASSTYAVGFSRAYARAVGLDEGEIAMAVREEIADGRDWQDRTPATVSFEPGDPARVPRPRVAWLGGLAALIVLGLVYFFWRSMVAPTGSLPDLVRDEPPQSSAAPSAAASAALAPAASGAVVFTALADGLWVKFYDATGTQLMQKQMALGETYMVPADANGPLVWTGRPEALRITVGGREVPPLSDKQATVKDVPVSAAALLARPAPPVASGAPVPAPSAPLSTAVAVPVVGQTSTVSN